MSIQDYSYSTIISFIDTHTYHRAMGYMRKSGTYYHRQIDGPGSTEILGILSITLVPIAWAFAYAIVKKLVNLLSKNEYT